jgi:chromatin segregation and condensation protein Rec8/ScpA/Scc1 (kleisin family)
LLSEGLRGREKVVFSEVSAGLSRRAAAGCFLELLTLASWGRMTLTQDLPFGDISLSLLPAPAQS